MKKNIYISVIVSFSLIFLFSISTITIADEAENQEKHIEVDYSVSCMECHQEETPDQTNEWKESAHGKMNFGCYMCHGDGEEEFYPSPDSERCMSCHSDHEVDFEKSSLNGCFDCHQGHTLKFHNEEN